MNVRAIQILVTRRCNLHCSYCHLQRDATEDLSWSSLKAALEILLERSQGELAFTFTGGEPLLAFDTIRQCVAFVEATPCRVRAVKWHVVTNGTVLNREALGFFDAHRFAVSLSFDGLPIAQAQRSENTFHIIDNLLDLVQEEYPALFDRALKIRMTLTPATVPILADSIEYLLDRNVRKIDIDPAFGPAPWEPAEIRVLRDQFARVAEMLGACRERGHIPVTLFDFGPLGLRFGKKKWTCGAVGGNGIAIDADGRSYACVFACPPYQVGTVAALQRAVGALAFGPLDAPDFEERVDTLQERARASGAFDHPELRYSSYRRCADCEFLPRCYACPLAASHDPACTDVRRVPDFLCAFNQVSLAAHDEYWSVGTEASAP